MSTGYATNRSRETTPERLGTAHNRNPHVGHTGTAASAAPLEGVILASLKLRLHAHVAGGSGPDKRVSLHDVGMRRELRRYIRLSTIPWLLDWCLLSWVTWVIFVVDFMVRLFLADRRLRYAMTKVW